MVYATTGIVDHHRADDYAESAAAKLFASQTLWKVASESLQIAGAAGYSSSLPYERLLRDARVLGILQGTDEILRHYIAMRGVGALTVQQGGERPMSSKGRLGLWAEYALQRARRAVGGNRMGRMHPSLRREAELLAHYGHELTTRAHELKARYGRDLADRELVQGRLADLAVDLFALAACLSRTTGEIERVGESGAAEALRHTQMFARLAEARMGERVEGLQRGDESDEAWLSLAETAYTQGGYPFDTA
jgi:acyl-CoA dehydrogenase family protein 9